MVNVGTRNKVVSANEIDLVALEACANQPWMIEGKLVALPVVPLETVPIPDSELVAWKTLVCSQEDQVARATGDE